MNPTSQNINLLHHNTSVFIYPKMCQGCSVAMLQISNSFHHHINISIEKLSYKGQNNILDLCKYAGLVVYDLLTRSFSGIKKYMQCG